MRCRLNRRVNRRVNMRLNKRVNRRLVMQVRRCLMIKLLGGLKVRHRLVASDMRWG